MIEKFIAIYVFIDDIMIEIGHKEPVNRNSSDSELIAVALIAAKYFPTRNSRKEPGEKGKKTDPNASKDEKTNSPPIPTRAHFAILIRLSNLGFPFILFSAFF